MSFVGAIRDALYALENPENARWMRQYMRNKYLFIGIKKPEQALVFKDIYKKYGNFDLSYKILDKININSFTVLEEEIKKDNSITAEALILLSVVKKMERVGDLIKNIAEEIIFYIDAEVLKHKKKK